MNFKELVLFIFSVLLLGCTKDNNLQEETAFTNESEMLYDALQSTPVDMREVFENPHLNGEAVERVLKIRRFSGTFAFLPDPDCAPYPQFVAEGTGFCTHMGKVSTFMAFCGDPSNPITTPLGAITAANGDQAFTELTGAGPAGDGDHIFNYIIYDGTGRFSGATGYYTFKGPVDMANLTFEGEGEGVIIY
ncbi:MAG: hypothetical protein H6560_03750 [Lewinellaceae bacterium]|nr:hypothetical protein [Lewinellaceae bacterium]